ncbi:MAG: hypothetical protein HYX67_13910 [Candidatus Melainabacteria bacterium]|nr:hypothetical protein [Candidatus Melainabacteria bacterium]
MTQAETFRYHLHVWKKSKFLRWPFLIIAALYSIPGFSVGITPMVGYAVGSAVFGGTATSTPTNHSPSFGYGLLFEFTMSRKVKFETGGIYIGRGFVDSSGSGVVTFTTLQFPLLIRVYVLPGIFVGAGAYFSYGLGSVSVGGTSVAYNQLSYGTNDYGPTACLGLKFGLSKLAGIIVQVRGLYGMANISQAPGVTTSLYDLQGFVGIKFGE